MHQDFVVGHPPVDVSFDKNPLFQLIMNIPKAGQEASDDRFLLLRGSIDRPGFFFRS